jgi:hypothetical protein
VESALPDNRRAFPIRATKMNATRSRLFVNFLFVDDSGKIDSIVIVSASEAIQKRAQELDCFVAIAPRNDDSREP